MPYGKNDIVKNNNVDYLGRDFNDLKSSLITYSKSYFPNTYKDFNETSPGMMLLELSAYVGDVLNFYIDQQYKEMMLPLAEERKNILTLAKSHGYKVNPISPAYVDLTFTSKIGVNSEDGKPNFNEALTLGKGVKVLSNSDSTIIFETLDIVDFTVSSSNDSEPVVSNIDPATGVATEYTLKRKVRAISGETKTTTFQIGTPERFKRIKLPETDVIEILKVTDSNNNIWYEVESLAQDKVPYEKHYTSDSERSSGYNVPGSDTIIKMPVPYSLEYIKTSKRFVTEIDEFNQTSLIFGNGILKNGNSFNSSFLAVEQVGINLPGAEENLETDIDPLLGDAYGTLGESPASTTLTIKYRIGGGIAANVSSNVLNKIDYIPTIGTITDTSSVVVTNENPASGGSSGESIEEIRHRTLGHISSQNRCVTKEDYEARVLNMPAKFGNIAKVYCSRAGAIRTSQRKKISNLVDRMKQVIDKNYQMFDASSTSEQYKEYTEDLRMLLDVNEDGGLNPQDFQKLYEVLELTFNNITDDDRLYTVDLYLLSYDKDKNLVTTPNIIKQNLKEYLNQFRLLTDQVSFYDGYVVNFGVIFDVVGMPNENKDELKVKCIQKIKDYFSKDKMQFKQVLYSNDLENLLMDVEGLRAVNYVTVTQDIDYNASNGGTESAVFSPVLYDTVIQSDGSTSSMGNSGFGYYYDFSKFYGKEAVAGRGVVLPAYEPAVFELKNPNDNIKGIIR